MGTDSTRRRGEGCQSPGLRIMAKPELPALRQPRASFEPLISKVSLYDV